MLIINEWLANPAGSDTKSEWVELWNSGSSAVSLNGWRLTADGKKFFKLQGSLVSQGYMVIPRTESRLSLKNTDGGLALYNPEGRLVDHVSFLGSAPEGKSANRNEFGSSFGAPTPGRANSANLDGGIVYENEYPFGVPLFSGSPARVQIASVLLVVALAFAGAAVFILKSYEDVSDLFFRGNQESGSGDSSTGS